MNKKHFIYSFQFVAALLSLAVFSSCEKDEFTEADALDLELMRLRTEDSIQAAQEARNVQNTIALEQYRRSVDSLRTLDMGGQVYYSVAVVPGGSSAFGQGRYDEVQGLNGATVSITQYGVTINTITDESGIATFATDGDGLRSGEATVNVTVDGFTDASYVVNLTPDGGVANNATQYVGNVVPVFENDADNPDNIDKMAMISGIGWAELDLTNNVEENAPENTSLSAVIDVDTDAFMDRYIREPNAYDEGQNDGELPTRSGFIQRIAYEEASEVARYDANGEYSMMVSATASGLPMKIEYSDFAADRTYWDLFTGETDGTDETDFVRPRFDGNTGLVSKRHIYGPDVNWRRDFITGTFAFGDIEFDLRERDANIEAVLTQDGSLWTVNDPQDPSKQALVVNEGAVSAAVDTDSDGVADTNPDFVDGVFDNAIDGFALTEIAVNPNADLAGGNVSFATTPGVEGGEYLADGNFKAGLTASETFNIGDASSTGEVYHEVEFVGGTPTTPATGYAVFSDIESDQIAGSSTGVLDFNGAAASDLDDTKLRRLVRIIITNPGEGYTSAPAVNIVRHSTIVTGTGNIITDIVAGTEVTEVRVIDGGYGFTPAMLATADVDQENNRFAEGEWIAVWNTDTDMLAYQNDPHVNYPASDISGVDLEFEYDFEVVGGDDLGVVQSIDVMAGGTGWDDASIAALNINPFKYWNVEAVVPITDGVVDLFTLVSGSLQFNMNTTAAGDAWGTVAGMTEYDPSISPTIGEGQISPNVIDFTPTTVAGTFDPGSLPGFQQGEDYVFVPAVRVAPLDGDPVTAPAELVCEMNGFGQLRELRIVAGGAGYTAQPIRVEFLPTDNDRLDAVFYTTTGSINNYTIDDNSVPTTTDHAAGSFVTGKFQTLDISTLDPEENSYWVSFSDPELSYGNAAFGVPVFDETALTGTSDGDDAGATTEIQGDIVYGIEILDAGLGYTATQDITWEIRTIGADGTDADDATLASYIAPSDLSFNIIDGGLGYAVRPDIFVIGGNVNLDDSNAPDPTDFGFTFNNRGEIVALSFNGINPYTLDNVADDPLQVIVSVEDQVQFMNDWWNGNIDWAVGALAGTPTSGPVFAGTQASFGNTVTNCDGITGFTFGIVSADPTSSFLVGNDASAYEFFNEMENQANGSGVPFVGGNGVDVLDDFIGGMGEDVVETGYIVAPRVIVDDEGTGGTGADVEVILNLATGDIVGLQINNSGSGYSCIDTNHPSMEPEPFRVIGGPDGNTVDADNDGNADYFEVYSGIQYVRDVHYGTGEELE